MLSPSDSLTFVLQTSPVAAHRSRELDSFRMLPPLSMPAEYVPGRHTRLSPLCPPNANGSRSRERSQFEAMLRASRERSATVGARKPLELRKEIAVKAQNVIQLERRARFLNKLCEPPSPSAADSPVTPPDSPTIFHFSLPSPGLQSPLEVFEDVHDHPERYRNTKRVEQVDFGLRYKKHVNTHPHHCSSPVKDCINLLPSLDQISQRLNKGAVSCDARCSSFPEQGPRVKSRLPSFLRRSQHPTFLEFTPSPSDKVLVSQIAVSLCPPPQSKSSQTLYPETTEFGSEQFGVVSEGITIVVTDDNPPQNNATPGLRAQLTKAMFNKLSRRTPGIPNAVACGVKARDDTSQASPPGNEAENKTRRRCSAPAGVPTAQNGAHHPVLEKPGGF